MSKRKGGWQRRKGSEEKRNREDAILQTVSQLDTFFTVKHTPNCIDTLDREAIHSSPTKHTPSPRFDSYCLSHDLSATCSNIHSLGSGCRSGKF